MHDRAAPLMSARSAQSTPPIAHQVVIVRCALTLAQTDRGLSCFLVERQKGWEIVRLKDKLGTRALPTAEVVFRGVPGRLIGEEGRGLAPVIENISHARLGPAVAPEMRAAVVSAIHHARHRRGVRHLARPGLGHAQCAR
jgi:putative acyl-CoA dehydrogenase